MSSESDHLWRVHPLLKLSFVPTLQVELLLEQRSFAISMHAAHLLLRLSGLVSRAHLDSLAIELCGKAEHASDCVDDLIERGALVSAEINVPTEGALDWVNRSWLQALLFHLSTRECGRRHESTDLDHEPTTAPMQTSTAEPHAQLNVGQSHSLALEHVFLARRSHTPLGSGAVTKHTLAAIASLSLSAAIHDASAVSAYVVAHDVDEVSSGIYRLDPSRRAMSLVKKGEFRPIVERVAMGQPQIGSSLASIVLTLRWREVFSSTNPGKRFRSALQAMGALAHSYQLMATSLSIRTFLSSGVRISLQDELLGIPFEDEGIVYIVCVG